ncbi:UBX domain-containing protein 7 [Anopheles ziemanni]|uniref:UBX domain-containing protein 7 n=1 Tax=Anopheles coustani TaxID=139045 RepID=UPI00265B6634|nr:UBX domain-containing protein 7 [Anopheles coustani]XP_058175358.1 UBX domain-containing protein 7 [Anopheles ziemanni]
MASEENVRALTEITGLEEGPATNLLTAYNGNLEGAINAFFENPEGILNPEPPVVIDDDSDPAPAAARSAVINDDDNVRAPIPRKTEILLPQIETNRARIGKRRGAVITEVPFRNFELEGRIQEQMLMQQDNGPSAKKITRLEALFMPPFDILFSGGFDLAQRHGRSVDRWLLVNLQDDLNFSCQTLNRDLWSDAQLKEFMRRHLVFWQQSNKTTDGAKFKTFYKVHSEPYIGMIDPRTGEEVRNFSSDDLSSPSRFLQTLKAFLVENKSPHGKEINVSQSYMLGMGPSTSSSSNGAKIFGSATTSTSTSAGSSGQGSSSGTSKQSSVATTSGTNNQRNRWVTVIDDDDDDFQEITDSESESDDNSRSVAVVPSAGGSTSSASKLPKAGPSSSAREKVEAHEKSANDAGTVEPSKAEIKEAELQPWEIEDVTSKPTALSSDSESTLAPDQKTRILLKMPGNVTERLFFRSSRTLERAMAKLRQKYEKHFPNSGDSMDVRFFCQAIKADLSSLDPAKTLLELKIHPNAVIHVTTDD